jgi:hypothetical protein
MSEETKQVVKIIIRGMKFTISLLEKWLRGEKI